MPETVIKTIQAYVAPFLLVAIISMILFIWNLQQSRISSLEGQVATTTSSLAVINSNMSIYADDRKQFQDATNDKLNKMQDLLGAMGNNLATLTAIQQRQDRENGKGQ